MRINIERSIFCIFAIALPVVAISVDLQIIILPSYVVQRTDDNNIYQVLFSAQASMASVVLAIITLLTSRISTRFYGLSLMRYIMIIKPSKTFRYDSVVTQLIAIVAISWASVAMALNNLAVALFVYTVILLIYLTLGVVKAVSSGDSIQNEIREFILKKNNVEYAVGLLKEIDESIFSGDVVLFRRDYKFAREVIRKLVTPLCQTEEVEKLENALLTIVRTALEVRFSKAVDVLELCVCFMEVSNDENKIYVGELINRDTYKLFSEVSFEDISGGEIFSRWQSVDFINKTKNTQPHHDHMRASTASSLYYYLNKNPYISPAYKEELFAKLLYTSYDLIDVSGDNKKIAELNYISYVVKLFEDGNVNILGSLIKGELKLDGVLISRNDIGQEWRFVYNRANVFIVIYMYYIAYRENVVEENDRINCQNLLGCLVGSFWDNSEAKYPTGNRSSFVLTNDEYRWFSNLLYQFQRLPLPNEFGVSIREPHDGSAMLGYVVLDFFVFYLTRTSPSVCDLENSLMTLFDNGGDSVASALFGRYAKRTMLTQYKEFCSISSNGHMLKNRDVKAGYKKLKKASENLYQKELLLCATAGGGASSTAK